MSRCRTRIPPPMGADFARMLHDGATGQTEIFALYRQFTDEQEIRLERRARQAVAMLW